MYLKKRRVPFLHIKHLISFIDFQLQRPVNTSFNSLIWRWEYSQRAFKNFQATLADRAFSNPLFIQELYRLTLFSGLFLSSNYAKVVKKIPEFI